MEIVESLARDKVVEETIKNIKNSRDENYDDLQDLTQMVYEVLCNYDDEKIETMWEKGQLKFFVARLVINQLCSKTSPYYYTFKKRRIGSKNYDEETM